MYTFGDGDMKLKNGDSHYLEIRWTHGPPMHRYMVYSYFNMRINAWI